NCRELRNDGRFDGRRAACIEQHGPLTDEEKEIERPASDLGVDAVDPFENLHRRHSANWKREAPPSTSRTEPVMYSASREQRNAVALAICSAVPNSPSGITTEARRAYSGSVSYWRRAIPAITIPGATTLTRIAWPASSRAIARASIRTPAFDTEYAEMSGQGISPTHEPVKMICPRVPRSTMSRAAASPMLKQPVTLTSR